MSNFYLKTPDGAHWLAMDNGRAGYTYDRMEKGYTKECISEEEFMKRYGEIMQHAI